MKLKVLDRLILLNVLPDKGDITSLRILTDLKSKLSFTEDELKALDFKTENGGTLWKSEADQDTDIEIGPKANRIIVDSFERLNKEKTLRVEFVSTYEKFIKED